MKCDYFLAANVTFWKPYEDGNENANATTKELKRKAFKASRGNVKKAIGIQVAFMLEIELQKYIF